MDKVANLSYLVFVMKIEDIEVGTWFIFTRNEEFICCKLTNNVILFRDTKGKDRISNNPPMTETIEIIKVDISRI